MTHLSRKSEFFPAGTLPVFFFAMHVPAHPLPLVSSLTTHLLQHELTVPSSDIAHGTQTGFPPGPSTRRALSLTRREHRLLACTRAGQYARTLSDVHSATRYQAAGSPFTPSSNDIQGPRRISPQRSEPHFNYRRRVSNLLSPPARLCVRRARRVVPADGIEDKHLSTVSYLLRAAYASPAGRSILRRRVNGGAVKHMAAVPLWASLGLCPGGTRAPAGGDLRKGTRASEFAGGELGFSSYRRRVWHREGRMIGYAQR
ncbi:hypothetical protein C8T65DRAFT_833038 [Cerioporus squamosus]|nr:hypothetical protein C8T65DRAFT_833038 [Cerioporus squamosus]